MAADSVRLVTGPRTRLRADNARLLFAVAPSEVYAHPPGMALKVERIPEGVLETWLCFAPNLYGHPDLVIGPFTPEVKRSSTGGVYVEASLRVRYWFKEMNSMEPNYPCWFYHGMTLRFVRKGGLTPCSTSKPWSNV